MKHDNLSVSIAMCTFNGEKFIQEQLSSFSNQVRLPDELIVCDDGSRDSTISLIEAYAADAPFPVHVYINQENLGYSKNFEKAFSLCHGDLIFPSDQDDIWLPQKIGKIEQKFRELPQVDYVFSDCELVNEKGEPLNCTRWEIRGFNKRLQKEFMRNGRSPLFLTQGCALAFRSYVRRLCYPAPSGWAFDDWIGMISSADGKIAFVTEPLFRYRQHNLQFSRNIRKRSFSEPYVAGNKRTFIDRLKEAGGSKKDIMLLEIKRLQEAKNWFLSKKLIRFDNEFILSFIEGKIDHFKVKVEMPESHLERIPCVIRELGKGRYHQYSRGLRSALRDILFKPY